jgi:Double zinc ribbon
VAATLTADQELTYASFPIEKVEHTADGDLLVFGKATDGTVDTDEQIVDPSWSQKALSDWLETGGNVRVQHQAQRDPAGKGVGIEFTPDGHYVKALIVEPVAKRLVEKGVLRAYSVGISRPVIERDITGKARGGLIKGGVLSELSLVDRPANGNCSFQLVKSAADGTAELVGKVFGADDFLAKAAAPDDNDGITGTVTFTPADMAKLLKLRAELEKGGKDEPPDDGDDDDAPDDSGGDNIDQDEDEAEDKDEDDGKDKAAEPEAIKGDLSSKERDALPGSSFAYIDSQGERHLPIHDEGHVKAALGRFNQTQFEGGKAKKKAARKILARASSMGIDVSDDSAVAQAAKKAAKVVKGEAGDCSTCHGTGKIMEGNRDCPDCGPGDTGKAEKAAPYKKQPGETVECPECHKYNSPDAKFCDQCGAKLPAGKVAAVVKAGGKACPGCGKNYHSDSAAKFCENCGKKLPAAEKSAGPVPAPAGETVDKLPEHREPDGPDIEDLEHDAGLPTVPDTSVEVKTARRHAAIGAPAGESVLHDLLCPAYSAKALGDAYPWLADVRDAVDVGYWRDRAVDKAAGAPIDEARYATDLWRHAETLKDASPDELARVHDEAHKAFQDANPGPGSGLTPGDVKPGSFKRPYLSGGHQRTSPGGYNTSGPSAHVPTDTPDAGDYHRGPLTAGHERPSPSSEPGSNDKIAPPAVTGRPGRTFYTNATRDSARSAMASMHDHIAQTFPDLCPMSHKTEQPPAAPRFEPDVTKTAEPEPVPPPQAATDKTSTVNKAAVDSTITAPDLTKQIGDLRAELAKSRRDYDDLRNQVEEMARMPDPRDPPFKGLMSGYPPARAQAEPASAVQKAASAAQGTLLNDLTQTWRTDPDPATRENAYKAIQRLLGLP